MAAKGFSDNAFVRVFNSFAVKLLDVPVVGGLVRRGMVEIRYVGRRSGKTIETPVNYRRSGEEIVIPVGLPDREVVAQLPRRGRPDHARRSRRSGSHRPRGRDEERPRWCLGAGEARRLIA